MKDYASALTATQREPIFNREVDMVENAAGGYAFKVDPFTTLERFLILGCVGGTFYVGERAQVRDHAAMILACAKLDATRTVSMIADISQKGRAISNDPAIFALALLAGQMENTEARLQALSYVVEVCRTGTHLFQFVNQVTQFRGWGTGLRQAVENWYTSKEVDDLIYQVTKYRSREGWTHRDVLRCAHPVSKEHNPVFRYITKGDITDPVVQSLSEKNRAYLGAIETAQKTTDERLLIRMIQEQGLVREHIPTQWLNSPKVWEALLDRMPVMALIRNLGKMSTVGLLTPLSDAAKTVCKKLTGPLYNSRLHPFSILLAQTTYAAGRGFRGSLTWDPVPQVTDALETAFYSAFKLVEPTGKNYLLGVDVSGSMGFRGYDHMGSINNTHIKAYQAAACMALVQMQTENWCYPVAFTGDVTPMDLSKAKRMVDVVEEMKKYPVGRTNVALPMLYATKNKLPVDAFIIYTDNESWCGDTHPSKALEDYRQAMGRDAKLVVCAMTATRYSVADPKDPGMLDVVGFDSRCPKLIADFTRGA
jgi:60 kDa SS-A/Ro ribonucleoprotein